MLLGDVRWLHSFDKKRRIRRILKIRRGRERERGRSIHGEISQDTVLWRIERASSGQRRLRGEKGRNICEVEVHREQRREQERFRKKGELVLDFFKNSCDCEKLFLTRKYDVLREFRYLYFNLSLNIV